MTRIAGWISTGLLACGIGALSLSTGCSEPTGKLTVCAHPSWAGRVAGLKDGDNFPLTTPLHQPATPLPDECISWEASNTSSNVVKVQALAGPGRFVRWDDCGLPPGFAGRDKPQIDLKIPGRCVATFTVGDGDLDAGPLIDETPSDAGTMADATSGADAGAPADAPTSSGTDACPLPIARLRIVRTGTDVEFSKIGDVVQIPSNDADGGLVMFDLDGTQSTLSGSVQQETYRFALVETTERPQAVNATGRITLDPYSFARFSLTARLRVMDACGTSAPADVPFLITIIR